MEFKESKIAVLVILHKIERQDLNILDILLLVGSFCLLLKQQFFLSYMDLSDRKKTNMPVE